MTQSEVKQKIVEVCNKIDAPAPVIMAIAGIENNFNPSAKKDYSFIHIEELFGVETEEFPDTENYLADGEYCDLINKNDFNFDDGSDGEAEDPQETKKLVQFFHTHKNKIVLGGGALAIILLGVFGNKK